MTMTVYYLLIHTTEHIYTHMGSMITPGHSLCIVQLYFSMEIKNCGVNSYNFSTPKKKMVYLKCGVLRQPWGKFIKWSIKSVWLKMR